MVLEILKLTERNWKFEFYLENLYIIGQMTTKINKFYMNTINR